MSSPKFFSDFSKTCNDIFNPKKKDYDLAQPTVEIKSKTTDPKTELTAQFDSKNGEIAAKLTDKIDLHKDVGTLKATLKTGKVPALELENTSWVDGLTLKFKTELLKENLVTAKFLKDRFAVETEVEVADKGAQVSLKPSLVFAWDCANLGASAVLQPTASGDDPMLEEYEIGAEVSKNSFTATAKLLDKHRVFELSVANQVNPRALFGIRYTYARGSKAQTIAAGGTYQLDDSTTLKGKLESSGALTTLLSRKVSDDVSISVSSQMDVHNFNRVSPNLGIKLVLGQ